MGKCIQCIQTVWVGVLSCFQHEKVSPLWEPKEMPRRYKQTEAITLPKVCALIKLCLFPIGMLSLNFKARALRRIYNGFLKI